MEQKTTDRTPVKVAVGTAYLRQPTRAERVAGIDMRYRVAELSDNAPYSEYMPLIVEAEMMLCGMVESVEFDEERDTITGEVAQKFAEENALFHDGGIPVLIGVTFRDAARLARRNGDLGSSGAPRGTEEQVEGEPAAQVLDS